VPRTPLGELTAPDSYRWCAGGSLSLPKTLLPLPNNPSPVLGPGDLVLRPAALACPLLMSPPLLVINFCGGLGNLEPKSQRGSRGGARREQFEGQSPLPSEKSGLGT